MDVTKFITLVFGHKCLWDQSDELYHSRERQRRAWKIISDELEISVDDLKKKWRGLRDTFGKELKKIDKESAEGSDTEPKSRWRYFKLMLFLRDSMSRKDTKGSVPDAGDNSDGHTSFDEEEVEIETCYPHRLFTSQSLDQNEPAAKKAKTNRGTKRYNSEDIDSKLLQLEEKKFKFLEDNVTDSDAQFLLSLRPFLKELPKIRNLIVRAKLVQVFIDEQNAEDAF